MLFRCWLLVQQAKRESFHTCFCPKSSILIYYTQVYCTHRILMALLSDVERTTWSPILREAHHPVGATPYCNIGPGDPTSAPIAKKTVASAGHLGLYMPIKGGQLCWKNLYIIIVALNLKAFVQCWARLSNGWIGIDDLWVDSPQVNSPDSSYFQNDSWFADQFAS